MWPKRLVAGRTRLKLQFVSRLAANFHPNARSTEYDRTPRRSLLRCVCGVTAVEFAIIAPVFFAMVYGVVETGRFFYLKSALQNAVDDTGRFAMTNPTASATAIINYAQGSVLESVSNDTEFTVTPDTVGSTNFVTIAADHDFQILVPLLPVNSLQINARARVPLRSN